MIISPTTKNSDPICQITGNKKRVVKKFDGTIEYFVFDKFVYDYFYELIPEAKQKGKGLSYRHKRSCYLNAIYNGDRTLQTIDVEFIENNWKQYCPTSFEYFLRIANGDVEIATKLHSDRQSTTSKKSFIQRYGEVEGIRKFDEHFKHIHSEISGDNHWTQNIEGTVTEHIRTLRNVDAQGAKDLFSGRAKLVQSGKTEDEIRQFFTDKAKLAQRPKTPAQLQKFREDIANFAAKTKESGEYYTRYGCWAACYKFATENDIEYTDDSRKEIWQILFDTGDVRYWINKGYSREDALVEITKHTTKISKQSSECLATLQQETGVDILIEQPFRRYKVDGLILEMNVVIEYYGDYWHCNPRIYQSNDKFKGKLTAGDVWKKDLERQTTLIENGYFVFVIWEYDWKNNKDKIISDFKQFLNERF